MLRVSLLCFVVIVGGCGKKTEKKSPKDGNGVALTVAQRFTVQNNMKHIMRAMHNHHDAFRAFPVNSGDPSGKGKGLSWRVHLLPLLDHRELYEKFHRDEPWDSPHNKQLISEMPELYKTPGVKEPSKTVIRAVTGAGTLMGGPKGIRMGQLKDGTINTAIVIEAGPEHATEWTRPGGLLLDPSLTPTAILGKIADNTYLVAMMDGRVRRIDASLSLTDLEKLFRYDDGEPDQAIFLK